MNKEFLNFTTHSKAHNDALLNQMIKLYHLIVNEQGDIEHVSDSFAQFLGYLPNNLIGIKVQQIIPEFSNTFICSDQASILNNNLFKQKVKLANRSYKVVEFSTIEISILSQAYKGVSHFSLAQDYQQSDEHQLFEQSGIAEFLVCPVTLTINAANQCAQNLCGLEQSALSQMLFSDLCEYSCAQLLNHLKNNSQSPEDSLNLELIVASGELKLMQLEVNLVRLSDGAALHIQAINVSDQKEQIFKIAHAENLNQALFNNLKLPSLMMDSFGTIERINPEMAQILDQTCDQLVGQRARNILPSELSALIPAMTYSSDQEVLCVNNELIKINFIQQPIRDHNNQSLGLLLTIEPIVKKQQPLQSKALEVSNSMNVFAIFVIDKMGNFLYVNECFERQTGYKSPQLVGQNLRLIIDSSAQSLDLKGIIEVINQQNMWRGSFKNTSHQGGSYWIDLTLKPMLDKNDKIESYVGVSVDITQQKELNKAGAYLANYDMATGLANPVLAKDRLEGMLSRAGRRKLTVAVIYLDISKMIIFTQDLGLIKSNQILVTYCNMLKRALRNEDALVRISQTRLAILLPDLPNTTAIEVVVAKIDKVNNQLISISDDQYDIDVRQGVSFYPEQCKDADTLFLNAESSLQRAWYSNERIGCFGDQQNESAVRNFNLRRDIVTALERDQIEVLYQPILELATNKVFALEARLQWNHEVHGSISGDDLHTIAEASGIMKELGLWMFEQGCIDLTHWREQGHESLILAINISHGQLRDKNVATIFGEILARYRLPPQLISLELPLSYIATQWLDLDRILQEFSLMGMSLQYDRFGERGAYISDLRNFPFTGLKISAEYISQLEDDPSAANLVLAIISMAKALNMKVTAVGVDHLAQMLQLQEMGCHFIQGDYSLGYSSRDAMDRFLIQEDGYQQLSWQ